MHSKLIVFCSFQINSFCDFFSSHCRLHLHQLIQIVNKIRDFIHLLHAKTPLDQNPITEIETDLDTLQIQLYNLDIEPVDMPFRHGLITCLLNDSPFYTYIKNSEDPESDHFNMDIDPLLHEYLVFLVIANRISLLDSILKSPTSSQHCLSFNWVLETVWFNDALEKLNDPEYVNDYFPSIDNLLGCIGISFVDNRQWINFLHSYDIPNITITNFNDFDQTLYEQTILEPLVLKYSIQSFSEWLIVHLDNKIHFSSQPHIWMDMPVLDTPEIHTALRKHNITLRQFTKSDTWRTMIYQYNYI